MKKNTHNYYIKALHQRGFNISQAPADLQKLYNELVWDQIDNIYNAKVEMLDYEVFCSLKRLFPYDHCIVSVIEEMPIIEVTNIQTNNGFNTPLTFLENA